MKKIILSTALLSTLVFVSCKKDAKLETTVEQPAIETPIVNEPQDVAEDVKLVVPTLKSAEAQKFLTEYTEIVTKLKVATASLDLDALKEMAPKVNEYTAKAQELVKTIPAEDVDAFKAYLAKLDVAAK